MCYKIAIGKNDCYGGVMDVNDIIAHYALEPHPEGGHFREIFRDPDTRQRRGAATSIYYLLKAGEVSRWHRIDAIEIWHYHAGATLDMEISSDGVECIRQRLGVSSGSKPQIIVPAHAWQSARTEGDWTLVGCTVAPAFSFDGFEMAPHDWKPGR